MRAVGHRVVHGGPDFSDPVIIDDAVVAEIEALIPLAPLHNPARGGRASEAARAQFDVPHVAVFDTAFFAGLPPAAATYAIPARPGRRRTRSAGTASTAPRTGTSRTAAAELVGRTVGRPEPDRAAPGQRRSASAVRGGVAIETSMGLTPLQGLVMGTRSGDVDPGCTCSCTT